MFGCSLFLHYSCKYLMCSNVSILMGKNALKGFRITVVNLIKNATKQKKKWKSG